MPNLKKNSGFSLIEILVSLLFIGALVTILFTTTGSLFVRRKSNLESVANKIAQAEIERLRGLTHTSLVSGLNCSSSPTSITTAITESTYAELNQLSEYDADSIVKCYDQGGGSLTSDIVEVSVIISWLNDNGARTNNYALDTLIYDEGL